MFSGLWGGVRWCGVLELWDVYSEFFSGVVEWNAALV